VVQQCCAHSAKVSGSGFPEPFQVGGSINRHGIAADAAAL
jgi:hypothetical protein